MREEKLITVRSSSHFDLLTAYSVLLRRTSSRSLFFCSKSCSSFDAWFSKIRYVGVLLIISSLKTAILDYSEHCMRAKGYAVRTSVSTNIILSRSVLFSLSSELIRSSRFLIMDFRSSYTPVSSFVDCSFA